MTKERLIQIFMLVAELNDLKSDIGDAIMDVSKDSAFILVYGAIGEKVVTYTINEDRPDKWVYDPHFDAAEARIREVLEKAKNTAKEEKEG